MHSLKKVYLEITNVCNLNCNFCPGTRRPKDFLSPAQFRILAEKLRPHVRFLYFHLMGEPLFHPQLAELLAIAEELDFRVMITTNGTLLPGAGELLCTSPAVHKVSISLHSFEGNSSNGSLSRYLDDCVAFAQAAAAAGKYCALRLWNLDGTETQGAHSQNSFILSRLAEHFPKPWKGNRLGSDLGERIYLEWGERFEWPDLSTRDRGPVGFCYGLRDHVGVLWDGTVVPCCLDHEGDVPLGNLYDQSLEEILESSRARAIYDGFSQSRAVEELCRKCGYSRRFL